MMAGMQGAKVARLNSCHAQTLELTGIDAAIRDGAATMRSFLNLVETGYGACLRTWTTCQPDPGSCL